MDITPTKPVVLIILDGWGIAPPGPGNAVTLAKTPNFNQYFNSFPHAQLQASGEGVGLPRGEVGNSETGHLNLGAGSIIYQELPRINVAIADGSFFKNKAFLGATNHVKQYNSNLHLMGLLGAGGVHSNIEHLFALIRLAKEQSVPQLFLHLFTDGRDSPPTSSLGYLKMVEEKIKTYQIGEIATITGRYYAMDRDNRWERVQKAYQALTQGIGRKTADYVTAIKESYNAGKTDEFIEPIIITDENGQQKGLIKDNDAVIFFNFRIDRPRELTKAFVIADFENLEIKERIFDPYAERYGKRQYEQVGGITTFKRGIFLKNLSFVTLTSYEEGLPVLTAFSPDPITLPLARVLSEANIRQFHIAETEKERHVTYYFDGRRENPFPGEDWLEIPSPKVATYDQKPEMSAREVTETTLERIGFQIYDFILINFANPDMVGHTGVLQAGIKACEITDESLGRIVKKVLALDGAAIITADHGNVEEMINLKTGEPDTEHSNNPVPFTIVGKQFAGLSQSLPRGILADVAPTALKLLGKDKPSSMMGESLI